MDGTEIDADTPQPPVSMDIYFIVTDKCTECVGFHDEPQCASVCPVDCCVDDPNFRESKEALLEKKGKMHAWNMLDNIESRSTSYCGFFNILTFSYIKPK